MVGQLVGNYRLVRQIGEGGMGVVYEAVHAHIGKRAAVKMLHPELSRDPAIAERFLNEARAVNLIQHSGLVSIFEFGRREDGAAYIVMEFLPGETLAGRAQRLGGRLAQADVLRLLRQIASALAAAHAAGIIHRDLKPDNIMIVSEPEMVGGERVKLLDFGIAKLTEDVRLPEERRLRTRTGVTMGTPVYMAPEQGRGARDIGPRADVYSLGVILYEVLCGHPPFMAESEVDLIFMHISDPVPPLREHAPAVPAELADLIERMLAKAAPERPTMDEVVRELELLGAPRAISASPAVTTPRESTAVQHAASPYSATQDEGSGPPRSRRWAVSLRGGLLVTLLVASAAGGGLLWQRVPRGSPLTGAAPAPRSPVAGAAPAPRVARPEQRVTVAAPQPTPAPPAPVASAPARQEARPPAPRPGRGPLNARTAGPPPRTPAPVPAATEVPPAPPTRSPADERARKSPAGMEDFEKLEQEK